MSILNQLIKDIEKARIDCPRCGGDGVIPSKEWEEFDSKFIKTMECIKKQNPHLTDVEVERQVWRELKHMMPSVCEELPCPKCDGKGYIYNVEVIQLKRLLQEILREV